MTRALLGCSPFVGNSHRWMGDPCIMVDYFPNKPIKYSELYDKQYSCVPS